MRVTKGVRSLLVEKHGLSADATDDQARSLFFDKLVDGEISDYDLNAAKEAGFSGGPTAEDVFGGRVDVKSPTGRYNRVRYPAKHALTGQPVRGFDGREVTRPSELDYALVGAWTKHTAMRAGALNASLSEHERELVGEMFAHDTWAGEVNGEYKQLTGMQAKALLSDSTSGGVNVNPLWYDQAIITYPLLHSQILPFVDLRDVPRSSTIVGAAIGNPTVTWGNAEGTSLPLFDVTGLIQALDSTIYPVMCAIEVGRDEMADSIVDLGQYLVANVGQAMQKELDFVCLLGNGTTQPQGILNATATISILAANSGGPLVLADAEDLMFGIGKQYRDDTSMRCCYISNDQMYSHFRAISIGADDARRVLGQDEGNYTVLNWPYRVCNSIASNAVAFGALARYRLYRRQGQEIRWSDQGQTLTLKNTALLTMRGRYGGRVMDTNAFAIMTDAVV